MDPELLQQLAAAGMAPEQLQLLQPRLRLGQQLMQPQEAQGRQVGGTYVAASPLEHLSNAVRQIVGAKMAGNAMRQQQSLMGQQRQARQSYMGALQQAEQPAQAPPDMLAAPGMDQASQDRAQQQKLQALEMMGAASGDPTMAAAAQFGLQSRNADRQASLLQNTLRHQQAMEEIDRAKVPRFSPDGMGGIFDTRTGQRSGGGSSGGGYSPDVVDALARQSLVTGKITMPPGVRGPMAYQLGKQISDRMMQINASPDLAGAGAGFHANQVSLAKQQQLLDMTKSWEATGKANLGVLKDVTNQIVNSGSPLVNKPLRWLFEKAAGDPTVLKFKAARSAVVNEYAKILSGSMGSAGVTDSARSEAESMIPLDATPAQVEAAASILETDAGNRLGSMTRQVQETQGRFGGAAPAPANAPVPAPTPAPPAMRKSLNGKTYEKRADGWYEVGGG